MNPYQRVYELRQRITAWERKKNFIQPLQDRLEADVQAEHKRLYPRRKKFNPGNVPEEFRTERFNHYKPLVEAYMKWESRWDKKLSRMLYDLAPTIELIPTGELQRVKSCPLANYRSQGWGASKYAKGFLETDYLALLKRGFQAELRFTGEESWNQSWELWANCEPWQLDCLSRCLNWDDVIDMCKQGTVNPLALYPGAPQWVYDKWIGSYA